MAKNPKQKTKPKKNKLLQGLAWVLAPLIAYIAHPTMIVALAGMIPTFVAYIIDTRPQRYAARTVGYMNFAGAMFVSSEIWWADNSWQGALELISYPTNWLIMFGCAALGWVFYYVAPPIVYAYLTVANEVKSKQLQKEQRELIKEWGDEVKTGAPDVDSDDDTVPKQIEGAVGATDNPDEEPDELDEAAADDGSERKANEKAAAE